MNQIEKDWREKYYSKQEIEAIHYKEALQILKKYLNNKDIDQLQNKKFYDNFNLFPYNVFLDKN